MTEQRPHPDQGITRGACATPRCCRRFLPGRNPVVPLRHKHQDTPARRYRCDPTGQTRLGVSRDCVTNTRPSARAGTPSCRCVTNTRTRQRVATTATQRVKRASARRAIASQTPGQAPGQEPRRAVASQTPGHADVSLPLRHNGSNAPRRVARLRHKHQDTPARRYHCDTTGQTRLGASRDCVTNTKTRRRGAANATQRTSHVTACRGNLDRLVCPQIPSPHVATRRVLADFAKTPTLERWQP